MALFYTVIGCLDEKSASSVLVLYGRWEKRESTLQLWTIVRVLRQAFRHRQYSPRGLLLLVDSPTARTKTEYIKRFPVVGVVCLVTASNPLRRDSDSGRMKIFCSEKHNLSRLDVELWMTEFSLVFANSDAKKKRRLAFFLKFSRSDQRRNAKKGDHCVCVAEHITRIS